MNHKIGAMIIALFICGCNGGTGGNGNSACTATFSGPISAMSSCQVTAVFASSMNQTGIAFSGTLMGSSYTWHGIDFDFDGRAATGTYDRHNLSVISGGLDDGGATDAWEISSQDGKGTLSFAISSVKVTTSNAQGDIYELHGNGTATMAYVGSRTGVADLAVAISY